MALEVLGAWASLLTVGQSTIDFGRKVRGAVAPDPSFKNLAETLCQLQAIWRTCQDSLNIEDLTLSAASRDVLNNAIQDCEIKSYLVQKIFERTSYDGEASIMKKFLSMFRRMQDIKDVETYIGQMITKTQLIVDYHSATLSAETRQQLVNIIRRMEQIEKSSHSRAGDIFNCYEENTHNQIGGSSQNSYGQSKYVSYANGEPRYTPL